MLNADNSSMNGTCIHMYSVQQRKAMEHVHNLTQYRSRYQTLVTDTPMNSKTEML